MVEEKHSKQNHCLYEVIHVLCNLRLSARESVSVLFYAEPLSIMYEVRQVGEAIEKPNEKWDNSGHCVVVRVQFEQNEEDRDDDDVVDEGLETSFWF